MMGPPLSVVPPLLFCIAILSSSRRGAVVVLAQQDSTDFRCGLCGDGGAGVADPDGIVVIPPSTEVTCGEVLDLSDSGGITEEQCLEVQSAFEGACECLYTCQLCEDGMYATNPDGVVSPPSEPAMTCRELGERAVVGNISEAECLEWQPLAAEPCGCVELSPSSSAPPTDAPASGPEPQCWTDLDELAAQMEAGAAGRDTSVPVDIILCPNTVYTMGRMEYENFTYVGGFATITPKPNTHWKCGEDGALSNNCTIRDGETAFVHFGDFRSGEGVSFQGIVFEYQEFSTLLAGSAGEVTFRDCVLRVSGGKLCCVFIGRPREARLILRPNHKLTVTPLLLSIATQNQTGDSPVVSVHIPPEELGRHLADSPTLYGYISRIASKVPEIWQLFDRTSPQQDDGAEARALQEENPDFPTILTMNFIGTVFEDCFSKPDSDFIDPAIVTSALGYTILNFDNVVFRNNDYGNPLHHPITAAILTTGPSLTVTDSCFVDNQFLAKATVLALGFDDVVTSNTYGTFTETLPCQFLAAFPNASDLATTDGYTCIEYDATACTAQLPEGTDPAPSSPPARPPPTEAPAGPTPTAAPPTALPTESGGNTAVRCRIMVLLLSTVSSLLGCGIVLA
jgi:hypothetical protein